MIKKNSSILNVPLIMKFNLMRALANSYTYILYFIKYYSFIFECENAGFNLQ